MLSLRRMAVPALLVACLASIVGAAAPPVTVLMRNGDRVSGLLEAMGSGSVWVREGGRSGNQRQLPQADVALIDFVGGAAGLPQTELKVARGSDHLLLVRDGTSHTGRVVRVEGAEGKEGVEANLTFVFRSGGNELRFSAEQMARLYLGNFPNTAYTAAPGTGGSQTGPPPPPAPAAPGEIVVPANRAWTDTNITVQQRQRVNFITEGKIQLSVDSDDVAIAAGSMKGRKAPGGAPLPGALAGALVGRIGNGRAFPIGNQTTVEMPANGRLQLGINDDELSDNSGEFRVRVTPTAARGR